MGGVLSYKLKICSFPPTWKNSPPPSRLHPHQIFIPPTPPKVNPPLNNNFKLSPNSNKNSILSCSQCSCTIFVLILYFLDTQVILILVLIDVEYSQKAYFSFEKGMIGQNNSSSGSHHPVKKFPCKISDSLPHWGGISHPFLTAIWKNSVGPSHRATELSKQ